MSTRPGEVRIVPATEKDIPLIVSFIHRLAEYERLAQPCVATEDGIRRTLFEDPVAAEVLLAYDGEASVGFALFFHNYSTFLAERGLYLEDLFVVPEARGRGIGYALFSALAEIALARNCGRIEWAVLKWNQLAIDFYVRLEPRRWMTGSLTALRGSLYGDSRVETERPNNEPQAA